MGPQARAVGAAVLGERRFGVTPRAFGSFGAPVMGAAFGFAWTPCLGPVLGAVTALAASRATLAGGVVLLFAYALGLGVPFLGVGLAFGHLTSRYTRAGRAARPVVMVASGLVIVFGVVLLSGHLGWLAAQMQMILRHIGLGRLATS
jgi:cytochrome c-type biogenesis protein